MSDSDNNMDHQGIDDDGIVERYVLGQLAAGEAQRFEEHFLDCAECLDRVEEAERLRGALTRAALRRAAVAATGAAVAAGAAGANAVAGAQAGRTAAGGGWGAAWGRLRRAQRFAFAAAGVGLLAAAAALPSALLLGRAARLDRELAAARAELARRPAASAAAAAAAAPAGRGPAAGAPPAGERALQAGPAAPEAVAARARIRDRAAEAAAERAEAARLAGERARAPAPLVDVPILALSLLRAAPGAAPTPAPAVRLPAGVPWVVVSLEPSDPGFPRYRVTLVRPGAAGALWASGELALGPSGTFTLALPRALLSPFGDFRLRVEGLPSGRPAVPAGEFPFRVDNS